VISGVSTHQDCCLGNGYWFQDRANGDCEQCHGEQSAIYRFNLMIIIVRMEL